MSFRINTNVPAITAQHRLATNKENLDHVQNKLASGSRIIRAADDASGLAVSEKLRATLRSTEQNIKEAHNGMFLLHTADGALGYATNMIIRIKELATAAASDTNGPNERHYLDNEVQSLKQEIDRLAASTRFNGRPLLTGDGGKIEIQVGPSNDADADRIRVEADFSCGTDSLGIANLEVATTEGAREALDVLLDAVDHISEIRGIIGANESALSNTISNLRQYSENLAGAYSQIRDADVALETAELAKNHILVQSGVSVLSQANNSPTVALKLIGT